MFRTLLGAVAMTTLLATTSVFAQDYPTRPVTMTMPYSAGGPGDTLARILAQTMTEIAEAAGSDRERGGRRRHDRHRQGRQIRAGRLHAADHPHQPRDQPGAVSQAVLRHLDRLRAGRPGRRTADDVRCQEGLRPQHLRRPARLRESEQGQGDLCACRHRLGLASVRAAVLKAIETPITTVPYKGTGPAMNDLMGGQVDFMCDQTANTLSHIKADKIKVLRRHEQGSDRPVAGHAHSR